MNLPTPNNFRSLIRRQPSIHKDINIETVDNLIVAHFKRFHSILSLHSKPLVTNQYSFRIPDNPPRRFKKRWSRDLLI